MKYYPYNKLIWSIAFVLALFLCVSRSSNQSESILGGFGYFILICPFCALVSSILLVLRLFKIVQPASFIYILASTASLAVGVYGFFLLVRATVSISFFWTALYLYPLVVGILGYFDTVASVIAISTQSKSEPS
jgi:hypothetical protein